PKTVNNITTTNPANRKSVGQAAARNAALINLFVTPGMGSLMAGRILDGLGQIILAVAGFVLVIIWFLNVMVQYYGMMNGQETAFQSRAWLGITGAIIFALSWLWALATSIDLVREARRNDLARQFSERHQPNDTENCLARSLRRASRT